MTLRRVESLREHNDVSDLILSFHLQKQLGEASEQNPEETISL